MSEQMHRAGIVHVIDNEGPWEFWSVQVRSPGFNNGLTWRGKYVADNQADAIRIAKDSPYECRVVYCGVLYHQDGAVSPDPGTIE